MIEYATIKKLKCWINPSFLFWIFSEIFTIKLI